MRSGASGRPRAACSSLSALARALWSPARRSRWRAKPPAAVRGGAAPRPPLAAPHAAPPHEEHLHRRLEVVLGDADDVEVLVALGHDLLALDGLAHAGQSVT